MTPIERIRRNREMTQLARDTEKPKGKARSFPNNASGLCILLFAVFPLTFKAIDDPTAANILGYGLTTLGFGLGILSLSKGQSHQALYEGQPVARAAPLPWKLMGSILMGLSAAGLTHFQDGEWVQTAAVLISVTALSLVSFGFDPRRDKGLDTVEERYVHRLETLAASVSLRMERIHGSTAHLAVQSVMPHLRAFDEGVNALLCAVTNDPARAGSVRKYFTVYLDGVVAASDRFAAVYKGTGCADTEGDYIRLLDKFANAFSDRAHQYAADGSDSLDVEIDVLMDYLARDEKLHHAS